MIKSMSKNNSHYKRNYRLARCRQGNHDLANAIKSFSSAMPLDTLHRIKETIHFRGLATYQNDILGDAIKDYNKYDSARLYALLKSFNNEMGNMNLNTDKYDSSIDCYP